MQKFYNLKGIEKKQELKSLLVEYIELRKKEESVPEHLKNKVKKEIGKVWEHLDVSIYDILKLHQAVEFMQDIEMEYLKEALEQCHIVVTKKDRKKGRTGYVNRLLKKYHKESVQAYFQDFYTFYLSDHIREIKKIRSDEDLIAKVEEIGYEPVWWVSEFVIKDNQKTKKVKHLFDLNAIDYMINLYLFYNEIEFEKVMECPKEVGNDHKEKFKLKQDENRKLKMRIDKVKKEKKKLNDENQLLKGKVDKLKRENERIYEVFGNEMDTLKEEKESLLSSMAEERQIYAETIIELGKGSENNEESEKKEANRLEGKRVCIIGGDRSKSYREAIEALGAELIFVSRNDYKKINGSVSKSDVVLFMTEVVGHCHFREAKKASNAYNVPFHFIDSMGVTTVKNKLSEIEFHNL